MENYLENCKKQLSNLSEVLEPIELVIGNESCDLDSAVSAVGLATIKFFSSDRNELNINSNKRIVIPILNINRNELQLKTEVLFWFKHIQLNCDLLICKDDIDFNILKTKKVLISLVDHNSNKQMSEMGEIVEIIDHHKYDPNSCPVSDRSRVLIDQSVGSCSTLIAERFLASDLRNDSNLRTSLSLMFFGSIILDTVNFSTTAQKFSKRDEKVIKDLESVIEDKSITRSEVYEQLIRAKTSTNHMTVEQLLLKDRKVVECGATRISISSISGRLVSELNLENERKLLYELASNPNNRFDVMVLLGIVNLKRDLAVFSQNSTLMETITSKLESESSELKLDLIKDLNDLRVYNQINYKASRKQIIPLISSIDFESKAKGTETSNGSPNNKTLELNRQESELEMPNIDVSKLNQNPESVYGSYIEDSFVGELVGDYPNNDIEKDVNDLENSWTLNNGITGNSELEFDFESFGPESIVYTENNDNLDQQNQNGFKFKHTLSEETLTDESNELNTKPMTQQNNENSQIEENGNQTPIQSLLVIPNQSSTSDSDWSPTMAEERDQISPFKRNASLTKSQRKKISPRINLQQILNSSDDVSPITPTNSTPTGHPLTLEDKDSNNYSFDRNNDKNSNTLTSPEDNLMSKGLVRRPSTTKKKIPVNREFFANDELNDKTKTEETSQTIDELTAKQESDEARAWRQSCPIGPEGDVKPIDMKVIDPYKKVISHGGYFHSSTSVGNSHQSGSSPAIIVFSACYLPDRSRKDYNYVMDNLFMYVLTTLHNLIADDYILIYFHNAGISALGNNMPTFGWLKRCYFMIDRRLKKNLKGLYLVHPTFWLKTLIIMSRPFISSKFSKKLKFISTLTELSDLLPIEHIAIPEPVKTIDSQVMSKKKKSRRNTK